MTCAHVVDVALKKVAGVESVEVSLNKGLATVKLKPGNTVSVPQLWELIHKNGYTPKATVVSVRGELANVNGRLQLKVSGTKDTLALVADPKNAAAYSEATKKLGQTVIVQGVMVPAQRFESAGPASGQPGEVNQERNTDVTNAITSAPPRTRGGALSYLSLFTSLGTLLCCALPSLLVLVWIRRNGCVRPLGGPVAGRMSHHKHWVFIVAGVLISGNFVYVYAIAPKLQMRSGACDPNDPAVCQTASRFSRVVLWCSAVIVSGGLLHRVHSRAATCSVRFVRPLA